MTLIQPPRQDLVRLLGHVHNTSQSRVWLSLKEGRALTSLRPIDCIPGQQQAPLYNHLYDLCMHTSEAFKYLPHTTALCCQLGECESRCPLLTLHAYNSLPTAKVSLQSLYHSLSCSLLPEVGRAPREETHLPCSSTAVGRLHPH